MSLGTGPACLLLALASALNVVWPMLHSVALRNLLLGALLLVCIIQHRRYLREQSLTPTLRIPGIFFLALSAWLLITVLFADNPRNSLSQYRGEWVMASIAAAAGLLLARLVNARLSPRLTRAQLFGGLGIALALPAVIMLGHALASLVQQQGLPLGEAPFYGRTSLSISFNMLYVLLLADALARQKGQERLLPLSGAGLMLAFTLSFFGIYLLNTRNGTICALLLTLLAILLAWRQNGRKANLGTLGIAATLLAMLAAYGNLSYRADPRWHTFMESTRIALDTRQHKAWLDPKQALPRMASGQAVDESAYMRMAWFKEGALAIRDYPLGVGFGRNAYGHAMQRKYGIKGGHSHSSLVDFTLSGGIPGTLLWLALAVSLLRLGWRAYTQTGNAAGIALSLLIIGTLLRMVVDSNLRDHGLEQTMFLFALLAGLSVEKSQPTEAK